MTRPARLTSEELIAQAIDIGHVRTVDEFTCAKCPERETCLFAFDFYNTNGDCLAEK